MAKRLTYCSAPTWRMQSHKLDMKSDIKSTLPSICCTIYAQASQPSNQVVFEIEIVGNLAE